MALPQNTQILEIDERMPNRTYLLDLQQGIITGYVDDLEAVKQSIMLMLNIERYESVIYNWDYGSEFDSLIGKPFDFVQNELQRIIIDTISVDDRVIEVTDFDIKQEDTIVHCSFTVLTDVGSLHLTKEVSII